MSNITSQIFNGFQAANPERFNEDLIFMRKKEQDETADFFERLFSSLKIPNITFLGSQLITDELEQAKYLPYTTRPLEESRLDLVIAKFKLECDGEEKEYTFTQYFPKLVDNFFFHLAGNRYYALYQISDKSFYSTSKALYLKTLLMPLGVKFQPISLKSMYGNEYSGIEYKLDIFRSKGNDVKNMFLYYFIEMGEAAIDYIFDNDHYEMPIVFIEENAEFVEYEGYDAIQLTKNMYLYFVAPDIDELEYTNLVLTLAASLKGIRKTKEALFSDITYLKKRILNNTSPNVTKADKAILSLKRILDEVTKKNLSDIPAEYSEDTWSIVKYMTWNFNSLYQLDTVDLRNRRLRLFEYMVYPLLTKFSDATYRILNSRNLTMRRLENVFSAIRPGFLIKNLINNELLRYNNATSTLELFSVALRYSARGPQALGSAGNGIILKYRGVHPSYVGNIGLNMASASDPGMTGTLCPLSRNVKDFNFHLPNEDDE